MMHLHCLRVLDPENVPLFFGARMRGLLCGTLPNGLAHRGQPFFGGHPVQPVVGIIEYPIGKHCPHGFQ